MDAGPPSHQRLVWPLPARPRQPPANCAPKREGGVWGRCQLSSAPGWGRASRGRWEGLAAGFLRVSENLVRTSKDKETRCNFGESQAVRLEGILFHPMLTAWETQPGGRSPTTLHARAEALQPTGVGWACGDLRVPWVSGQGVQGKDKGVFCKAPWLHRRARWCRLHRLSPRVPYRAGRKGAGGTWQTVKRCAGSSERPRAQLRP